MTQVDLKNLCLNLLKLLAIFQQISFKRMFLQNEINLFSPYMKIFLSLLLPCSSFLNSVLAFNTVGYSLLKDTPFTKLFQPLSSASSPNCLSAPLLGLSFDRSVFWFQSIISAVQHRHCQSCFKQAKSTAA